MNTYRAWQSNPKQSLSDNVRQALDNYISKHGLPEQIVLEYSSDLIEEVVLPDGLNIVKMAVRLPKNIFYVGRVNNETSSVGMEVASE